MLFHILSMMKQLFGKQRRHRTKLVRKVRCQIFRQIAQKFRRHTAVWQGISGQYDGKSVRRLRAKPSGGFCAVLPKGEYRSLLPLTRKIPEPLDKFRSVMYNSICNLSKL